MTRRSLSTGPDGHGGLIAILVTLLATLVLVAGCSAAPSGTATLTPAGIRPTRAPDTAAPATSGTDGLPPSIVGPVVAEIARLAGVPEDQVTVVSAESVTFPDGGLGCPIPGMVYIQVQVDGYRIVAEAGGKTYDYRGSAPGQFRQCKPAG